MEKSRGPLTRERIASEAVALLDEGGLESLSMRKLGARLSVEAMSLYNHVRNKDDLLDAIHGHLLDQMTAELAARPPVSGWDNAARSMTMAFLEMLKRHPNAISLFASRSAIARGSLALVDSSIGLLLSAGFTPKDGIQAFQTLFAFTIGHAVFHYGRRSEASYASPEEYARLPHLAQLGSPTDRLPDDEFAFGLDLILTGLRQHLLTARIGGSTEGFAGT